MFAGERGALYARRLIKVRPRTVFELDVCRDGKNGTRSSSTTSRDSAESALKSSYTILSIPTPRDYSGEAHQYWQISGALSYSQPIS